MSILETFYILFKSDASEVKKGADEAEKATKNLESSLQSVGRESAVVGREFATAAGHVLSLFAGIASISTVIRGLHSAVADVSQLGDVARELNVNVETLDAWDHAVQRTGGTAQSFQHSLSGLAEHLSTTNEVALKTLPVLADALSKMNQVQANRYGKSLGLDQSTIYLLQQGRREVEATIKQQQKLGLVTQEDVKLTREFDNALYDAGRAFQTFYRQLAIPALPFLTTIVKSLTEHKDFIVGAFIAIGAAGALLAAPFIAANSAVILLTAGIVALIGVFALVFEDIRGFMNGIDSLTGRVLNSLKSMGESIKQWGSHLPAWVKKLTGFNSLAPGGQGQSGGGFGISNPFKGQSFSGFLGKIIGHNALASNNTVKIDNINVNTQATDADGISKAIGKTLTDHLQQAAGTFDNSVRA